MFYKSIRTNSLDEQTFKLTLKIYVNDICIKESNATTISNINWCFHYVALDEELINNLESIATIKIEINASTNKEDIIIISKPSLNKDNSYTLEESTITDSNNDIITIFNKERNNGLITSYYINEKEIITSSNIQDTHDDNNTIFTTYSYDEDLLLSQKVSYNGKEELTTYSYDNKKKDNKRKSSRK